MVRRMIATITQIESVVTPSGNSGHVVVPKAWIGKEAIVTLKESKAKGKKWTTWVMITEKKLLWHGRKREIEVKARSNLPGITG
jgi:putative transposon-encoded protein